MSDDAEEGRTARGPTRGILFHCQGDEDGAMFDALKRRLPDHDLRRWPERGDPADITDAVVWQAPEGFFAGLAALERVHALSAGVDALLADPALPADVTILRLEDAGMGRAMAEYVLWGVLTAQRRFLDFAESARAGRWAHELPFPAAGEFGVGILGAGAMGQAVAARLAANGYPVGCWSRGPRALPAGIVSHVGEEGLEDLLGASRALVCLLPLTDATRGILDAGLFAQLPEGAWLINAGRGAQLVEADLLDALDTGRLGGALLDVFATEPLPSDDPLWRHPRVIVTPHVAAPSQIEGSVAQVAANITAISRGQAPNGAVSRERGY